MMNDKTTVAIEAIIDDLHIRLDHIQGTVECIELAAYHDKSSMSAVQRGLKLIANDLADAVNSISDLGERIRHKG